MWTFDQEGGWLPQTLGLFKGQLYLKLFHSKVLGKIPKI